jgi:hypothetical protein
LRRQAGHCLRLGSPLYADLLQRAADDAEAGGPVAELLHGHEDDPVNAMLALRLMGAVHRRVLEGALPAHEVGRCAALLPGFLAVSREAEMPLRLLEVGASAGLNLRWDLYRYEADSFSWGDADSAVRLHWVERVQVALDLAAKAPVEVDCAAAAEWIGAQLAERREGVATVVFHSIVMQYLDDEERGQFELRVRAAGVRADAVAPLAWLRMEPAGERAEVRLTFWPGRRG